MEACLFYKVITTQQYTCGKKCLKDFGSFIHAGTKKAQSPPIREAEHAEGAEDSTNTAA